MSGLDRNANNRSGMLWEVERILKECVEKNKRIPQFLLMENVKHNVPKTYEEFSRMDRLSRADWLL